MVFADLDEFIRWHATRTARKTGRQPAASTLRVKRARLSGVVRRLQLTELRILSTHIQDRDRAECLLDLLALDLSSGSLRQVVDVLREFGEYAVAKGWITGCAITRDDMPPMNPQKPIVVYTQSDIDTLIGCARGKSLRWFMFLATLAETGRRVGEVLGLEWEWLHVDADVPHFALPHTKNGKQNYVPLTKMLREEVFTPENCTTLRTEQRHPVRAFHRPVEVFPFPWTHQTVTKMLAHYCNQVGVTNRGFHNFRHTRITQLLSRGVPMHAVSKLAGHASTSTTDRIYNHASALSYAHYVDE